MPHRRGGMDVPEEVARWELRLPSGGIINPHSTRGKLMKETEKEEIHKQVFRLLTETDRQAMIHRLPPRLLPRK